MKLDEQRCLRVLSGTASATSLGMLPAGAGDDLGGRSAGVGGGRIQSSP